MGNTVCLEEEEATGGSGGATTKTTKIDTTINGPSQGAEGRGGDLLSIRLNLPQRRGGG